MRMELHRLMYRWEAEANRAYGRSGTPTPSESLHSAVAIWEHAVCSVYHLPLAVFATWLPLSFKSAAHPTNSKEAIVWTAPAVNSQPLEHNMHLTCTNTNIWLRFDFHKVLLTFCWVSLIHMNFLSQRTYLVEARSSNALGSRKWKWFRKKGQWTHGLKNMDWKIKKQPPKTLISIIMKLDISSLLS